MVSIVIGYEGADEAGIHSYIARGVPGLTHWFSVTNYLEFQDAVIAIIERVCISCGLPPDGSGLRVVIEHIPD